MAASLAIAISGIMLARRIYLQRPQIADKLAAQFGGLYKLVWNKWYIDNIYEMVIVIPLQKMSHAFLFRFVDKGMIDGAINGSARATGEFANVLRRMQTGVAPNYVALFVAGILFVLGWVLWG